MKITKFTTLGFMSQLYTPRELQRISSSQSLIGGEGTCEMIKSQ